MEVKTDDRREALNWERRRRMAMFTPILFSDIFQSSAHAWSENEGVAGVSDLSDIF